MTEALRSDRHDRHSSTATASGSQADARTARWWQLPLRTLLLLMTALGVWAVDWGNKRAIDRSQLTIQTLRPLAHELVVTDPLGITVVHRDPTWMDENVWDLNLPEGRKYRLCVGTRGIVPEMAPAVTKSRSVPGGKVTLALEVESPSKSSKVVVRVNGQEWLVVEESADWNPGRGSTGGAAFSTCATLPADQPVILCHRRFLVVQGKSSVSPPGPANGVVLWLEPE